ncbi:MAG: hypothetical protein KAX84_01210 [Burkholderiales bacterium]|nr:hypothetical protein [Burkholderiales bacterium]
MATGEIDRRLWQCNPIAAAAAHVAALSFYFGILQPTPPPEETPMRHRLPLALMFAAALFGAAATIGHAQDAGKVLRIALPDITSLDPQQLSDLYSRRVADAIFEGLYQFDYLASPAKVIPNTAAALPVITDGGRTWTIALQRGIHFAPDPVFKANPRELVAADYVYAIKRLLDPGLKTGGDPALTDLIEGARPVVDAARKNGRFDYDAAIEGLRATDTHTLRIRLTAVDYTMLERLALINTYAVAREAVEAAGPDVLSRPVGTGPFRLAEWRRGSRVVLEANPGYRKIAFPAHAEPAHRALVAAMQGRRLPALQRIEISIIEEQIPEVLGFEQGSLDYTTLTGTIVGRLAENGRLRPDLAKRGVGYLRYPVPALIFTYFNQDDPVVGGNAPARIALRRAIAMGFDNAGFIRTFYGGHALPANQLLPPGVAGHDPKLPAKSLYDPPAARAARTLRLPGPRWRRLPRSPGRQPADAGAELAAQRDGSRGGHVVGRQHEGDRPQDDDQQPVVQRPAQGQQGRPVDDVQPGQPRRRAFGLHAALAALGQVAARHQPVPVPQRRLRRRVREVSPDARRPGARRPRPQDVRHRQRFRAVHDPGVPDRQRVHAAVAAGLPPVAVRLRLEVPGHRFGEEAGGWEVMLEACANG